MAKDKQQIPQVDEQPNPEYLGIIEALYQVRQQKSALEKTEKLLATQLKETTTIEAEVTVAHGKKQYGEYVVQIIPGTNRIIKADLLLEKGVSPEVIQYATRTTGYSQLKITKPTEEPEG